METTTAPLLGEPLPVELMNTVWADRAGVHDALAAPEQAAAWLAAVAPRTGLAAPADLAALSPHGPGGRRELGELSGRLVELRDALRRLAAEATGDPRPAAASATTGLDAAVAAVNAAAAAVPRWSALSWQPGRPPVRATHTGGRPGDAMVSAIAEEAVDLLCGDGRTQLRSCLAPGCVLYFVRNHPRREWCSTACGNRARAARHYDRHRRNPS